MGEVVGGGTRRAVVTGGAAVDVGACPPFAASPTNLTHPHARARGSLSLKTPPPPLPRRPALTPPLPLLSTFPSPLTPP